MSIGHGHGADKARQALDQALHHPLLETVHLGSARGVIANLTGGQDLSLGEVQSVLTALQEQTSPQTEIVMGVMQDDRFGERDMEGRVQVTLIITGLGAPTLEETLSGVPAGQSGSASAGHSHHPSQVETLQPERVAAPAAGHDLPTYIRLRGR
jgi:cell division protein FtsZ